MTKNEKIVLTAVLGFIPPVFLFVLFWFVFYAMEPERSLFPIPFIGLATGIVIDIIYLKRWVASCHQWPIWILILIFSFYHIGMLGFFMGVPLFNAFLGLLAGYYYGNRILRVDFSEEKKKKIASNVSLSTSLFMLVIGTLSAWIALSDQYTSSNLEGMFGLNYNLTHGILISGIIIGGIFLVVFTWLSTHLTMKYFMNNRFLQSSKS
jgi:hypothetical protein